MKRQDEQSEVADSNSSSENTPPQPFNLFAGLQSEQLRPADPSVIQQSQPIAQSAAPSPTSEPQSPTKSNRSLIITAFVIAALIIGILIGFQLAGH